VSSSDTSQRIIEFWQAVEMFSPQEIPGPSGDGVFDVSLEGPFPWSPGFALPGRRLTKDQTHRHLVYFGVHRREEVFRTLREPFPPDKDADEKPLRGSSALLALALDEKGRLQRNSVALSACAWAMARALEPGPDRPGWLDGFTGLQSEFAASLEQRYIPVDAKGEPRPVVFGPVELQWCLNQAVAELGVAKRLELKGIRVQTRVVAVRTADRFEHDFLSSFIADDLSRVSEAVGRGRQSAALGEYLRPRARIDAGRRVDVRTEVDEVRRATEPDRVPLGRWPSAPNRPLALGQQLAVNDALAMRHADEYLVAVNGPPGTGKTTMLRDLIAAILTERAECLADLANPREAFAGPPFEWKRETSKGVLTRVVRQLRPELTGFEIVVASSNNGAVDNVTREIPAVAAIDEHWRGRAKDLEGLELVAARLMSKNGDGSPPPPEGLAWGLIAAPLGKAENRSRFVDTGWWTERRDKEDKRPPPPAGFRDLLVRWSAQCDPAAWKEAVRAFREAHGRATALRDERLGVSEALGRIPELEAELRAPRDAERAARDQVIASRPQRKALATELPELDNERRRLEEAREQHRRAMPFFLRFRARAIWRADDEDLARKLDAADARLAEIRVDLASFKADDEAYEEARDTAAPLESALDDAIEIVARYRKKDGAVLPDFDWSNDRDARERCAPWSDVEWNEARSELFLAAFDLHRAFLVGAALEMREGLAGMMEFLKGDAPPNVDHDAVLAAWRLFFMAVPVASTTFASFGRLFGGIGRESLGWLLIDEAGQATPQNAVGALWRCRRSVVTGDPLQLEPVSTIPSSLEDAILRRRGIEKDWLVRDSSAQHLADRLGRFGTNLPAADGPVWVGAPLVVHRRCHQPMFDISNEIAYGGLMIDATDPAAAERFDARYPGLPSSRWIDVPSGSSSTNWIPAEGVEFDRLLGVLGAIRFDFTELMVIGPFRDVAREVQRRIEPDRRFTAGTIHVAQGKEADIVILVLGSNPTRSWPRQWAAEKPNLLNVAVSRAKHRLYVIGDRDRWMSHPYFDLLAARLPHESRASDKDKRPLGADS
jgi:AAA domain